MSRPMLGLCGLLLTLSLGSTYTRAQVWISEHTLWTDAVRKAPRKPRPWINLGLAREVAGDIDGAFVAHQTALALSFQPRLTEYQQRFSRIASETNIARLLAQTGREEFALPMLNDILTRHPLFPWARYNRGVLLARLGRCQEGRPDFELAERLDSALENPGCPPEP